MGEPWLQDPDVTLCACGCRELVVSPDAKGRKRRFRRGHNLRVNHPLEGRDNWWTGRRHTTETRAALSVAASRPKPWIRGDKNGMANKTGASNPNWRGGVSPERQRLYASGEWRSVARQVKRRDGGCVRCNAAGNLHVHHVKSFASHPELRLDTDNLVTLCRPCHISEHRKGGGE